MRSRDSDTEDVGLAIAVILVIATIFILWQACEVQAQPLPDVSALCAPEVTEGRREVLARGTQPGIWFHLAVAQCMLGRLEALPLYAQRVTLLEQRLLLSDERDALQRHATDLAVQESQAATGALEAASRRAREAEEAIGAWHRSPVLWFIIGAVVAAGVVALSAYALNAGGA